MVTFFLCQKELASISFTQPSNNQVYVVYSLKTWEKLNTCCRFDVLSLINLIDKLFSWITILLSAQRSYALGRKRTTVLTLGERSSEARGGEEKDYGQNICSSISIVSNVSQRRKMKNVGATLFLSFYLFFCVLICLFDRIV